VDVFAAKLRRNTLIKAINKKHQFTKIDNDIDNDIYNIYIERPFDIRGYIILN